MKNIRRFTVAASCLAASSAIAAHSALPNYLLHGPPVYVPDGKNVKALSRTDAKIYFSDYYKETASNTAYHILPKGTTAPDQSNQRIEAYAPSWKASSASDWHYWEGTYYIGTIGDSACLFQLKSPDPDVSWEFHLDLTTDGTVWFNHRRDADRYGVLRNMLGKSFIFRIYSNGRTYRGHVEYDGKKVYFRNEHQMDPSGNSSYAWRWGIYKIATANDSEVRCWDISYR